jgi:O-antigen/teichoic acid export membrane protein
VVLRFGRRDLAKDTILGFVYEGSVLVSTLLSFSLLGRSLGTEGFGDYAGLYSIAAPLITLASTGVALAQAQHVVREHEDLERTTRSCFTLSLVGGLLMTVFGTLLATLIVRDLPLHAIIPIFLVEFISYPAVLIAANTVQVRDGYAASTPVRLVPIVLRMIVLLALFASDHLTIATLGASYLVVTALLSIVQIRRVGQRYGIKLRPGPVQKRHLKSSLVYSSGVSGLAVQNDGDKTVLAAYHYRTDLGLYSAAYKIVQFGLIPVNTWMSVSHNRFLVHDEEARGQHLRRALRFGSVCALYGAVERLDGARLRTAADRPAARLGRPQRRPLHRAGAPLAVEGSRRRHAHRRGVLGRICLGLPRPSPAAPRRLAARAFAR